MTQTICDQCGRPITKAIVGFDIKTREDEPREWNLCSPRCLEDFQRAEYPVRRPKFEETRALLDEIRDREERFMRGELDYGTDDDIRASLPYDPPTGLVAS